MKKDRTLQAWSRFKENPTDTLMIQASLPDFLHTLPILISYRGPGSALAGSAPSAPPENPAHD